MTLFLFLKEKQEMEYFDITTYNLALAIAGLDLEQWAIIQYRHMFGRTLVIGLFVYASAFQIPLAVFGGYYWTVEYFQATQLWSTHGSAVEYVHCKCFAFFLKNLRKTQTMHCQAVVILLSGHWAVVVLSTVISSFSIERRQIQLRALSQLEQ